MKKSFFTLIIIFNCFGIICALDIGAPTINAICRVELRNGEIKEGIICILNGGYDGYRKNGFICKQLGANNFTYHFFSVYDFRVELNSFNFNYKKQETEVSKCYYALTQYQGDAERHVDVNTNDSTLIFEISDTYRYKLVDSIYLFEELNGSLYLPWYNATSSKRPVENIRHSRIKVEDIKTFELLQTPDEKWWNIIQKARGQYYLQDPCDDCQEPLWYHEIRRDVLLYNKLMGQLYSGRQPF